MTSKARKTAPRCPISGQPRLRFGPGSQVVRRSRYSSTVPVADRLAGYCVAP